MMSYIGEARGFAKTARELADKLRAEAHILSKEERKALEIDIAWYERESRSCWLAARQEAKEDEAANTHNELEDEGDDGA